MIESDRMLTTDIVPRSRMALLPHKATTHPKVKCTTSHNNLLLSKAAAAADALRDVWPRCAAASSELSAVNAAPIAANAVSTAARLGSTNARLGSRAGSGPRFGSRIIDMGGLKGK